MPATHPATPTQFRSRDRIEKYSDLRKLLDNKDIDAISTATPNHWHALITVLGCQAGKDVYCEKPTSHEVWEGRKAVEAARKYDRIVQAGTQSRSMRHTLKNAFDWVQAGNIGKINVAHGLCYKRRSSIGKVESAPAGSGKYRSRSLVRPRTAGSSPSQGFPLRLALVLANR